MDSSLPFLAVCAVLFVLGTPVFLLIRSQTLRKRIHSLAHENEYLRDELRHLTRRVRALEQAADHGRDPSSADVTNAQAETKDQQHSVTVSSEQNTPVPPQVPALSFLGTEMAPSSTTERHAWEAENPVRTQPQSAPSYSSTTAAETQHVVGSSKPFGGATDGRHWADIEEKLGANWLNKIGTAAFVIGVALLLNYSMHYLGARGKIGLGYALSLAFIAGGILCERKERYRIAGRAVVGGGWALTYFTTYALHNIASVRLVDNPIAGFVMLFAVAAGMVAHSLRYNSEVTTGFAYLLAFASIGVSHIPVGALVASALLAVSLAVIMRLRSWYAVEPFAILATYSVHWIWIHQVYERMGGRKLFPEFRASVAILSVYWLIYLVSYFLRREGSPREQRLLTASFLLNSAGYLAVLHYQAFHPEWRFWFLLATGAVYLGVAAYSRRINRRLGFLLASTLGAALMIAAVPYRYSGRGLEIFWIIEAEALLIVGWRAADSHLRKLGWLGSSALTIYVLVHDLSPRFAVWQPPNTRMGWMLVALAIPFYLNRRLKFYLGAQPESLDEVATDLCPIIATGFLLAAAWVALPFSWSGLIWIIAGIGLVEAGTRLRDGIVRGCGHAASLLAVARLLVVNMAHGEAWHNVTLRLITVGCSSALLYLFADRAASSTEVTEAAADESLSWFQWLARAARLRAIYTSSATILIAVLLWHEVANAAIGLAWGLLGIALIEAARTRNDWSLLLQGRLLLLASFARIFFADLNATQHLRSIPTSVLTVSLLSAIYYFAGFSTKDSARIRMALLWFGTISLAALLRFQLSVEWVAVSWSVLAVILYGLGRFNITTFRSQSYVIALLVGARCAFDNFYQVGPWHFTNIRIATVVSCALLLYILFAAALLTKGKGRNPVPEENSNRGRWWVFQKLWMWIEAHPQHLFFFIPTILLTVLLSLEVRRGFLTAAWGLEALIVFLGVLKLEERAYRWFSLILFLLCVGRIITVDVWNLDALGRIVSFMGLGAALLAVSFLYARHREILRRVL
jgi:uncharacterized membrane protein